MSTSPIPTAPDRNTPVDPAVSRSTNVNLNASNANNNARRTSLQPSDAFSAADRRRRASVQFVPPIDAVDVPLKVSPDPTPKGSSGRRRSSVVFAEDAGGISMRRVSVVETEEGDRSVDATPHTGAFLPAPLVNDDTLLTTPHDHNLDAASNRSSGRGSGHGNSALGNSGADEDLTGSMAAGYTTLDGQNSFAFIAVENDRLERERVMALIDSSHRTLRHRWFCILEGRQHDEDELLALVFNTVSITMVMASCVIFCVQSLPANTNKDLERQSDGLFWSETACIVFFVFEAILRVVCVPISHLFNAFFFIDCITILGYVVELFSSANVLSSVSQALRLLRVFRVFKLSRHSTSLRLVFAVLYASMSGLSVLVLPLALVSITCASIIYFFEVQEANWDVRTRRWLRRDGNPAVVQSVPDALWFAMTTISTVGYGDIVPQTIGGKVVAVFLMFVGVLTLSFPNIVLGANLQLAFKSNKQAAAVQYLTQKMRKVLHCVAFIRRVRYWVALRKARDRVREAELRNITSSTSDAFEGGGLGGLGRTQSDTFDVRVNYGYFPATEDFNAHRKPNIEAVTPSNLRFWAYRGVHAVQLLQLMLEVFSGVATVDELHEELTALGVEVRRKDVALACIYMAEGKIIKVFMLERNTIHILTALSDPAVTELMLHQEVGSRMCKRSAEYARFIWKTTTKHVVPFQLAMLFNRFPLWARRERYAEDDTEPDLLEAFRNKDATGSPVRRASSRFALSVNHATLQRRASGASTSSAASPNPLASPARPGHHGSSFDLGNATLRMKAMLVDQDKVLLGLLDAVRRAEGGGIRSCADGQRPVAAADRPSA